MYPLALRGYIVGRASGQGACGHRRDIRFPKRRTTAMNRAWVVSLGILLLVLVSAGMRRWTGVWMGQSAGRQLSRLDGPEHRGRIDCLQRPPDRPGSASHEDVFAVLNKQSVFLGTAKASCRARMSSALFRAGFRGLVWSPDGKTLYASTEQGHIQTFQFYGSRLSLPTDHPGVTDQPGKPRARRDGDHS